MSRSSRLFYSRVGLAIQIASNLHSGVMIYEQSLILCWKSKVISVMFSLAPRTPDVFTDKEFREERSLDCS